MSPGQLIRLREDAGYTLELAARRVYRTASPDNVKRLREFETGAARPTFKVMRSLLAAYHVEPVRQDHYLRSYRVAMRLKQRASDKGITLKHVADKVGVDRTNISKFFNGSRVVRNPELLLEIASALEMDDSEKKKLLQEAGFETFHLGLGGPDHGDLATTLLDELRRGVGPDRQPRTEHLVRPGLPTQIEFQGASEIVAAASELVLATLPDDGSSETTIRISAANLSMILDPTVERLTAALRIAVERGVSLQLLLPLGGEPEKILNTLVVCLQYLGQPGRFEVRWFDPSSTAPPLSLVIPPDDSVLLFLPGRPERAAVIRPRVTSFVRHFDQRFEAAHPLLKLYDSARSPADELVRGLADAEADSEVVLVVKRRVTPHTLPEDLWPLAEQQLEQHRSRNRELVKPNDPLRYELLSIDQTGVDRLQAEYRRRLEGHLRNLAHGTVREIYLKEYLEETLRYPSKVYPPEARIAIIDHLLGWLSKYPRYRIGLATEGGLVDSPLFGVHNPDTVFLSVWRRGGGAQYLEVRHPIVARVFQQYFLRLWSNLASGDKSGGSGEHEADGVTAWLESLRKELVESETAGKAPSPAP